ncbi:hypothetical protein [Fredinandcohnia onubensis]|uniref:hypothetical protein n=1 Tax=Fredinandcohnia onubensis TaxID=1571209 RepID=UPI0015D50DF5|nr:hypothetical protein [Fredinandcohnia onubensis]
MAGNQKYEISPSTVWEYGKSMGDDSKCRIRYVLVQVSPLISNVLKQIGNAV